MIVLSKKTVITGSISPAFRIKAPAIKKINVISGMMRVAKIPATGPSLFRITFPSR